jgi:hypothetical protein
MIQSIAIETWSAAFAADPQKIVAAAAIIALLKIMYFSLITFSPRRHSAGR